MGLKKVVFCYLKCCLYNNKWKETFENAKRICGRFHSNVYSLKTKGFKEILENYATYLSLNYYGTNTNGSAFWTSCKLNNTSRPELVECTHDTDNLYPSYNYHSQYPTHGLYMFYVNFGQKKFKIDNLQFDTGNLARKLDNTSFILVRRHQSSTRLNVTYFNYKNQTYTQGCFLFNTNNEQFLHLSVPYLNMCVHFTLVMNNSVDVNETYDNYDKPFEQLSTGLFYGILNTLGIIEIKCVKNFEPDISSSNFLILDKQVELEEMQYCASNSTPFYSFSIVAWNGLNSTLQTQLRRYLTTLEYKLVLHSYSIGRKILYISCRDTFNNIELLLEKCSRFNDNTKQCMFACPSDCSKQTGFVSVWQWSSFRYTYESNVCNAARHSNLLNGTILIADSDRLTSLSDTWWVNLHNNGVETHLWPPVGLSNMNVNRTRTFYFQNASVLLSPKNRSVDSYLVIKANFDASSETAEAFFHLYASNSNYFNFQIVCLNNSTINPSVIAKNVSKNLTSYQLNLGHIDGANYIKLNVFHGDSWSSVKFPINLDLNSSMKVDYPHSLLVPLNAEGLNYTFSVFQPTHDCHWHVHGINLTIGCVENLTFLFDRLKYSQVRDIQRESLLIYPKTNVAGQFLTITFGNTSCKHGGVMRDGECSCRIGFGGVHCELVCPRGRFGKNCELQCPDGDDCQGYLICTQDPVGCSCGAGFKNRNACNEPCDSGFWGPDCAFDCDNNCSGHKCDRFTGLCDWKTTDNCQVECKSTLEPVRTCLTMTRHLNCSKISYSIVTYTNRESWLTCTRQTDSQVQFCLLNSTAENLTNCQVTEITNQTMSQCESLFEETHKLELTSSDVSLTVDSNGNHFETNETICALKVKNRVYFNNNRKDWTYFGNMLSNFSRIYQSQSFILVSMKSNNDTFLLTPARVNVTYGQRSTAYHPRDKNYLYLLNLWIFSLTGVVVLNFFIKCLFKDNNSLDDEYISDLEFDLVMPETLQSKI